MPRELFRKVALERISSPEQLDQLITITTPAGWLSLWAIIFFLAGIVVWGIYGSIPSQVQGQGILLKKAGLVAIQSPNPGKVTSVSVELGEIVVKGQVVARLQQDDLLKQIERTQLELKNLDASFDERTKTLVETVKIQLEQLRQEEENQNHQIKNLQLQLETQRAFEEQQRQLKKSYEDLFKEGVVSRSKILDVENQIVNIGQNINALQLDIERAKNQLHNITLEFTRIKSEGVLDTLSYEQQVEKLKLEIRRLQSDFAESSQVLSPYRGRVVEMPRTEGDLVNAGATLFLLEKIGDGDELEVVAYFSPFIGKQIQKGMKTQIAPSIVKREEYGSMEGLISEVDEYPSTFPAIMKTLQNETLAQMLVANAAPIEVRIDLFSDEQTVSGYKWSSGSGPQIRINSGTICFITVTVTDQAPITLVIPLLKKYILGEGK